MSIILFVLGFYKYRVVTLSVKIAESNKSKCVELSSNMKTRIILLQLPLHHTRIALRKL